MVRTRPVIAQTVTYLPARVDLLRDLLGQLHPLASQGHLQLVKWKISGLSTC